MSDAAQFAAKCHRMATTIPRGQQRANEQAARAIKAAWFAASGLSQGSMVAGRKVAIRDSTVGTAKVTTLISWVGPVHLVEGPTKAHVIAAKGLTTRGGARSKLLGSRASFGGSARGSFAGSSARKGKRGLKIGPNVRAYAFHPGTKGRGFWERNKADAYRIGPLIYKQSAIPSMLREAGFG